MSNYQIQLPIDQTVKIKVEEKAKSLGIIGINATIRFLLINFINNRVNIDLNPLVSIENYKKELDKEKKLMKEKIIKKNIQTFNDTDKLMNALSN